MVSNEAKTDRFAMETEPEILNMMRFYYIYTHIT